MAMTLTAAPRQKIGSQLLGLRNSGLIPAIVYGHGIEPRPIQVGVSEFQKVYRQAGTSTLIDVVIDGAAPVKALIQEIQVNPLTMKPQHIDFRQIKMDEELTVAVPLEFVGESLAVKGLAGTLVRALDEITVSCLPADLPSHIVVDLSVLKTFDDSITIGSLKLPAGVTTVQDPDQTIANVAPPMTEEQLKKMEDESKVDVTSVKTEAEEKRAAEAAKEAAEAAADAK